MAKRNAKRNASAKDCQPKKRAQIGDSICEAISEGARLPLVVSAIIKQYMTNMTNVAPALFEDRSIHFTQWLSNKRTFCTFLRCVEPQFLEAFPNFSDQFCSRNEACKLWLSYKTIQQAHEAIASSRNEACKLWLSYKTIQQAHEAIASSRTHLAQPFGGPGIVQSPQCMFFQQPDAALSDEQLWQGFVKAHGDEIFHYFSVVLAQFIPFDGYSLEKQTTQGIFYFAGVYVLENAKPWIH